MLSINVFCLAFCNFFFIVMEYDVESLAFSPTISMICMLVMITYCEFFSLC
jgi:hypothetical protein